MQIITAKYHVLGIRGASKQAGRHNSAIERIVLDLRREREWEWWLLHVHYVRIESYVRDTSSSTSNVVPLPIYIYLSDVNVAQQSI